MSSTKGLQFPRDCKVKLHLWTKTQVKDKDGNLKPIVLDGNGNAYITRYNMLSENDLVKNRIMVNMVNRLVNKQFSNHTGGWFYDFQTDEKIGRIHDNGKVEYYI